MGQAYSSHSKDLNVVVDSIQSPEYISSSRATQSVSRSTKSAEKGVSTMIPHGPHGGGTSWTMRRSNVPSTSNVGNEATCVDSGEKNTKSHVSISPFTNLDRTNSENGNRPPLYNHFDISRYSNISSFAQSPNSLQNLSGELGVSPRPIPTREFTRLSSWGPESPSEYGQLPLIDQAMEVYPTTSAAANAAAYYSDLAAAAARAAVRLAHIASSSPAETSSFVARPVSDPESFQKSHKLDKEARLQGLTTSPIRSQTLSPTESQGLELDCDSLVDDLKESPLPSPGPPKLRFNANGTSRSDLASVMVPSGRVENIQFGEVASEKVWSGNLVQSTVDGLGGEVGEDEAASGRAPHVGIKSCTNSVCDCDRF